MSAGERVCVWEREKEREVVSARESGSRRGAKSRGARGRLRLRERVEFLVPRNEIRQEAAAVSDSSPAAPVINSVQRLHSLLFFSLPVCREQEENGCESRRSVCTRRSLIEGRDKGNSGNKSIRRRRMMCVREKQGNKERKKGGSEAATIASQFLSGECVSLRPTPSLVSQNRRSGERECACNRGRQATAKRNATANDL